MHQDRTTGASHSAGCLFCRRHDGGFASREHIFSEAYGNQDKILKRGVVCDRCNNGPLSRADHALSEFPPIKLLRAERGIPTKAGKAVEAVFGNGRVAFEAPGLMSVTPNHQRLLRHMPRVENDRLDPAGGRLSLTAPRSSTNTVRNMARAIWKSALELIYLDHGPEVAYGTKFDPLRDAVITASRTNGFLLIPKESQTLHNEVHLTYWHPMQVNGRDALMISMDIFGIRFWTDGLRRDAVPVEAQAPEPVNIWTF